MNWIEAGGGLEVVSDRDVPDENVPGLVLAGLVIMLLAVLFGIIR